MKKSVYKISIVLLMAMMNLNAQDHQQALRYSQHYIGGTARYAAMGGAFGALGGDFSAVSSNPAGLGLYRSSEFTITPVYQIRNVNSSFLGENNRDLSYNLGIGNLGLATTLSNRNSNIGVVLGFGYNALNDFSSSAVMSGINETSSFLDNFTWFANNSSELDPLYEGPAHEVGLIAFDEDEGVYFNDFEVDGYGQDQLRVIETSGFIGEYAFSAAFNINHTLYIGSTIGIHAVRFYENIEHTETDRQKVSPILESFRFDEYNSTVGSGIAFKLGVIFRPIQALRLGASFQAPVLYNLTDEKYTDIYAYWDRESGFTNRSESSDIFGKDYTLRTPMKASASAAVVLGKLGLLSAEYEYMDYSTADLDSPGYNFTSENTTIRDAYRAVHNIKAGAELRLNPVYLRAGAQYYMNPQSITSFGSDILVYSGGIGFRNGATYLDIAYSLASSSDVYSLYFYDNANGNGNTTSENQISTSKLSVTLGYRF